MRRHVDEINVEKPKKAEKGQVMLMNLSVLMQTEKVEELGEDLEKIDNRRGVSVRFTGLWPPYSFV